MSVSVHQRSLPKICVYSLPLPLSNTHTHKSTHKPAGGSAWRTADPSFPGGGVAAGSSSADVIEGDREVFTVCAVSARILSTSTPLRKRWNLAFLGSGSSGPANMNLLHWILPEHGQAAVRFILRAREELADSRVKDAGSIRIQMLVIGEDSVGDILWCTLTVLAPASRAAQHSGLSAILLEVRFDAPASQQHAATPAGPAPQASFVAAQKEGWEGVFRMDALHSTVTTREWLPQSRHVRKSFGGPLAQTTECDPQLEVAVDSVLQSVDSQKKVGFLSGWGDALLDRVASCVMWAACMRHTFVPDAHTDASVGCGKEHVSAGKGAVSLAKRGTAQIHFGMRAPKMLASLSTPWYVCCSVCCIVSYMVCCSGCWCPLLRLGVCVAMRATVCATVCDAVCTAVYACSVCWDLLLLLGVCV